MEVEEVQAMEVEEESNIGDLELRVRDRGRESDGALKVEERIRLR